MINSWQLGVSKRSEILGNTHRCFICPFHPWWQRANLRLSKFQCLKLSLFKHNRVWSNSRQGKNFGKCLRVKITWGKKNSYTVLHFVVVNSFQKIRKCPNVIFMHDTHISKGDTYVFMFICLFSCRLVESRRKY